MTRTRIRLDDELLAQAKLQAARTGRTLTAVIEDALRESLARSREEGLTRVPPLPSFRERGVRAGVDLDDAASLLDLMAAPSRPASPLRPDGGTGASSPAAATRPAPRATFVPDAYLAALAIESGREWITTDRDYARFPGLRWRHPLDTGR